MTNKARRKPPLRDIIEAASRASHPPPWKPPVRTTLCPSYDGLQCRPTSCITSSVIEAIDIDACGGLTPLPKKPPPSRTESKAAACIVPPTRAMPDLSFYDLNLTGFVTRRQRERRPRHGRSRDSLVAGTPPTNNYQEDVQLQLTPSYATAHNQSTIREQRGGITIGSDQLVLKMTPPGRARSPSPIVVCLGDPY
jgi:hypothetical protein